MLQAVSPQGRVADSPNIGIGTVKWFNLVKGYGFIAMEHGADVFLHEQVLAKFGIDAVWEGIPVEFEYVSLAKGFRCTSLLKVDFTAAPPPPVKLTHTRERDRVNQEYGPEELSVKWYKLREGYGFFESERGDVFVHVTTLQRCGLLYVAHGERYWVRYGPNQTTRKLSAIAVKQAGH